MASRNSKSSPSPVEEGDLVYWAHFDATYGPLRDREGRDPELPPGMESGTALSLEDPGVWAGTIAFPEAEPDPDAVAVYAGEIRAKGCSWTPVWWRDGIIRGAPTDELTLEPIVPEVRPKRAPAPKKTANPKVKVTQPVTAQPISAPNLAQLGFGEDWEQL